MKTSIERAWASIKQAARERAISRVPLKAREAKAIVTRILNDEHVSPWPDRDVIEFYASELMVETTKRAADRDLKK
jgi:hypothetical protein